MYILMLRSMKHDYAIDRWCMIYMLSIDNAYSRYQSWGALYIATIFSENYRSAAWYAHYNDMLICYTFYRSMMHTVMLHALCLTIGDTFYRSATQINDLSFMQYPVIDHCGLNINMLCWWGDQFPSPLTTEELRVVISSWVSHLGTRNSHIPLYSYHWCHKSIHISIAYRRCVCR